MTVFDKIIFVCTGNTCRSPMAEGLLKKLTKDRDLNIMSRGLMVFGQQGANLKAIKVMEEMDVDLSSHMATPFDWDECSEKTLVLTMTQVHKKSVLGHGFKGQVYTVKEFVGEMGDVKDPYGKSIEAYRQCAMELKELVSKIGGKV